jgi:hypothetical protein
VLVVLDEEWLLVVDELVVEDEVVEDEVVEDEVVDDVVLDEELVVEEEVLEDEYVEPLKVNVYALMEVASWSPGLLNSPTANAISSVEPTPSVGKSYGEAFFRANGR